MTLSESGRFRNLLSNAIKFTDQGGVTLPSASGTVRIKTITDIAVSDTGIGIAPDNWAISLTCLPKPMNHLPPARWYRARTGTLRKLVN